VSRRRRERGAALVLMAFLAWGCERNDAPAAPPPTAQSPNTAAPPPAIATTEEGSRSPNASLVTNRTLLNEMRGEPHPQDGRGRAWFEGEKGEKLAKRPRLQAGEPHVFRIAYEAGPDGIAVGGSVHIRVPITFGWTVPQVLRPDMPGAVQATTDAKGVEVHVSAFTNTEAIVEIAGRALRAGERIHIRYDAGMTAPKLGFADDSARIWLLVDGDGDGRVMPLDASPEFEMLPTEAARLFVAWPTTARPGEHIRLTAAALDRTYNVAAPPRGKLTLRDVPSGLMLRGPRSLSFAANSVAETEFVAEREGIYRVTLEGANGLLGTSNPLVVSNGPRILWGDLHGHSHLSDGTGRPEDYFRYARDVSRLDVSALTDHDHYGSPRYLDQTPEIWKKIRDTARAFHAPGHFVTLLGFEWTNWIHGHRHVLYFEDDGPIISSIDPATETPRQLWDVLRGRPALTFAHHSAGGPVATNWAYAPDPVLEPLTEIVSIHGSSESLDTPLPAHGMIEGNTVRDALARGYTLGFVGSGDTHDGHPGCTRDPSEASCGLAGIFSEDASRVSVLEALRARRSYATNGPRILMRITLDGQPMGAAMPAEGKHSLVIDIVAEKPLASLDLMEDGGVVENVPTLSQRELRIERVIDSMRPGGYLYVRAVQLDKGAAWSSPFFFH
jgi:hypothetical protein